MLTPTVMFPSKTFKDLKKIELVPPPNAGAYWRGIPHLDYAQTFINEVKKSSLKWVMWDEGIQIITSMDAADIAMSVLFEWPKAIALPSDLKRLGLRPFIGAMASNAQRFAMSFYAGIHSELAGAGMVLSEIDTPHRRHTEGADLSLIFTEVLDNFTLQLPAYANKLKELHEVEIQHRHADFLTVQIGRRKILPWSRAGKFDSEFQEYNKDDWTGLTASLAFGKAVAIEPPFRQLDEMLAFHNLLNEVLAVAGAAVVR